MRKAICFGLFLGSVGVGTMAGMAPAVAHEVGAIAPGGEISRPSTLCGPALMRGDGSYENGYAWSHGGVVEPNYGAFAERFAGRKRLCGLVVALTNLGTYNGQTADLYLWSDAGGMPGNVLYLESGVSLGEIAHYPGISENAVEFSEVQFTDGVWWAGIWGDWPGEQYGWFLMADENGEAVGTPMTNRPPNDIGPTGWVPCSDYFPEVHALGIGVLGVPLTPADAPEHAPIVLSSFGQVKALYR
ncbi:MAG: hypothetical protein IT349_11360 [Candidatus Eisenbacteria bacterium]|nr:hypothetical protein [Candidatus Eisenbacteria bacterium]